MRKQHLIWTIVVFGVFATIYGGYLLIYHFEHENGLSVFSLVLLIFGVLALLIYAVLLTITLVSKNKKKNEPAPMVKEGKNEETPMEKPVEKTSKEEKVIPQVKAEPKQEKEEYTPRTQVKYESSSSYSYSTVYIKQLGYGPIIRVDGERILDIRNNTYYRLENNILMQEGYGPVYEIRGNQIKNAFGGYLYELSGSNINKVCGGFYASISGNYITLYDASIKYEMTDSLSKRQILVVAALLFGKY